MHGARRFVLDVADQLTAASVGLPAAPLRVSPCDAPLAALPAAEAAAWDTAAAHATLWTERVASLAQVADQCSRVLQQRCAAGDVAVQGAAVAMADARAALQAATGSGRELVVRWRVSSPCARVRDCTTPAACAGGARALAGGNAAGAPSAAPAGRHVVTRLADRQPNVHSHIQRDTQTPRTPSSSSGRVPCAQHHAHKLRHAHLAVTVRVRGCQHGGHILLRHAGVEALHGLRAADEAAATTLRGRRRALYRQQLARGQEAAAILVR